MNVSNEDKSDDEEWVKYNHSWYRSVYLMFQYLTQLRDSNYVHFTDQILGRERCIIDNKKLFCKFFLRNY